MRQSSVDARLELAAILIDCASEKRTTDMGELCERLGCGIALVTVTLNDLQRQLQNEQLPLYTCLVTDKDGACGRGFFRTLGIGGHPIFLQEVARTLRKICYTTAPPSQLLLNTVISQTTDDLRLKG